MSENLKVCPRCGKAIQAEAPQGLCPQCLLAAVSMPTEATGAGKFTIPAIADLAAAFPQLEIIEMIGQGGMGVVFKARQPKLDRIVALKILPQSLAVDAAFAERFSREGRVLARLNHPNIVTVHDFGQANGFFYLLMEYVDGANLRQAMKAGRFTPDQALAVVPKVCEALQYAHNEGILHRDIKPENILLDSKGRVKIADFGIAKLVGEPLAERSLTASGARLGTPHYMAPEQIEKPSEVDHRADIYSLGVVFYEMLTGELPLGRFARPSEKSAADPRLDDVVFRTLEKEPGRRQQSAGDVKTQVENITSNAPPRVEPKSRGRSSENLPTLKASPCYITTPEHLASFAGQLNLYRGRGELRLNDAQLSFSHALHGVTIPLHSIRDLSIGHYPWAMKPSRLDFLCLTFEDNGRTRRVLLTPHESRWMPTWNTNEVVAEWYTAVREAIVEATGKAPSSTPAAQLDLPRASPAMRLALGALVFVPIAIGFAIPAGVVLRFVGDGNPIHRWPQLTVALMPFLGFMVAVGWIWSRKRQRPAGVNRSPGAGLMGLFPALMLLLFFGVSAGLALYLTREKAPPAPTVVEQRPLAPEESVAPPRMLSPDKVIELSNNPKLSVTSIHAESVTLMEPGERVSAWERHPDGRTLESYTSYTRDRMPGGYESGYLFIWHLPQSFKPEYTAVAQARLNQRIATPITFSPGVPVELFSVTNETGSVFIGLLQFDRPWPESQREKVVAAIQLASQPEPFGNIMEFYSSLRVSAGYELNPAGGISPKHNGETQIGIWGPANDLRGSLVWKGPRSFGSNEIASAYEQLRRPELRGVLKIPWGEPLRVFTITNAVGEQYHGYLKLFGPPPVGYVPLPDAMRGLGERVGAGDTSALNEIQDLAVELYRHIDYVKDRARVQTNYFLMTTAFDAIGQQAGNGSQAARDALKLALNKTLLNDFAAHALGRAAALGNAESLDMLLHHDHWRILKSSAVSALKAPAEKGDPQAVEFLADVIDSNSDRALWFMASDGLKAAAAQGNIRAKAACEKYAAASGRSPGAGSIVRDADARPK